MRFSGCQLDLPKLDTILKKLKTAHKTQFCSLNCSRDLNPLGSDIGYNFYAKPYSTRISGSQLNGPKLDTFFKNLRLAQKTQFCCSLSNPHVQVVIEQKHHSDQQKRLRPVRASCI